MDNYRKFEQRFEEQEIFFSKNTSVFDSRSSVSPPSEVGGAISESGDPTKNDHSFPSCRGYIRQPTLDRTYDVREINPWHRRVITEY
ncbi:hypothetical protein Pdw03_0054 [Penicillium digitatum]|uniref:Uncharacterized protein n=1 Tax=Penicillium digitatum TaxID=36651 RepID=A0A7T7BMN1_PENDI|nr:hypothetical protein Pdw03_0054 [Penicillium digitatum]